MFRVIIIYGVVKNFLVSPILLNICDIWYQGDTMCERRIIVIMWCYIV